MVCDVPLLRSSPSLGKVLHEKHSNIHSNPQLLGSQVVMNIIMVLPEGASYVHLSHQVWLQRSEWERNTCEHVPGIHKCVRLGKNSQLKGLLSEHRCVHSYLQPSSDQRHMKYVCVQYMPIRCAQIMCMCTNRSFTFHFCYETKLCCVNSDLIHNIGLKVGDELVCLHDSRALN